MKTMIISDLYNRVQQTIKKRRRWILQNNCCGSIKLDILIPESFEFLIFLEVMGLDSEALLHYPVSVGHEAILENIMCEQLEVYKNLLPHYRIAVVAIEHSLVKFDEWEALCAYPSAETLVEAIIKDLDENSAETNKHTASWFRSKEITADKTSAENSINKIEVFRFSDDDGEPVPIVISIN